LNLSEQRVQEKEKGIDHDLSFLSIGSQHNHPQHFSLSYQPS